MDKRICSLETEYALVSNFRVENSNPHDVLAEQIESAIRADFDWVKCNSFGRNAREAARSLVQIREGQFIQNGSRVYYDIGHFEWANPETIDPMDSLTYDKAAERNLIDAVGQVARRLRQAQPDLVVMLVKNNLDYAAGTTYGCHENYSLLRTDNSGRNTFDRLSDDLVPFLVTRSLFSGSGRIGARMPSSTDPVSFQLSQRADFIEQSSSLQTRSDRSLLNLRDEPLADAGRYRRLHLIVGDSNMSEFAGYMKVGTTSLVLSAVEENLIRGRWALRDAVGALHRVSRDGVATSLTLVGGGQSTALDIQRGYCQLVAQMTASWPADHFAHRIVRDWMQVIEDLESNDERVYQRLDWAIKVRSLFQRPLKEAKTDLEEIGCWLYVLDQTREIQLPPEDDPPREWMQRFLERGKFQRLDAFVKERRLDWSLYGSRRRLISKLYELDFRYHHLDPENGLYFLLAQRSGLVERFLDEEVVSAARRTPPRTTRAWQRGQLIHLSRERQVDMEVDWDKVILTRTGRIIQMADPFIPEPISLGTIPEFGGIEAAPEPRKKINIKIVNVQPLEKH